MLPDTGLLRIANADSMNTVQIEETYNRIAKEAGISETNVVDNQTYLAANYITVRLCRDHRAFCSLLYLQVS